MSRTTSSQRTRTVWCQFHSMLQFLTNSESSTGYNYEASAYIFPQYDDYGKTFWIPSHVEPTVAMIGTSLPAMLQLYSSASFQFSKVRSYFTSGSGRGSESGDQNLAGQGSLRYRMAASGSGKFQEIGASQMELRETSSHPSSTGRDSAV